MIQKKKKMGFTSLFLLTQNNIVVIMCFIFILYIKKVTYLYNKYTFLNH